MSDAIEAPGVRGQEASSRPTTGTWTPFAESALKQAGVAAAVLYAVASVGQREFYNELGIRTQEVGNDRAEVASRAAVALVGLIGVASPVLLVAILVLRLVQPRLRGLYAASPPGDEEGLPISSTREGWLFGMLAMPPVLALYLLFVDIPAEAVREHTRNIRLQGPVAILVIAFAFWRWQRSRRNPGIRYKLWGGFGGLVGVLALFIAAREVGHAQALYLREEGHLPLSSSAPGIFIQVSAHCVRVTATSPAPTSYPDNRFILLGASSGTYVMWDYTAQQSVRMPAAGVLLRGCPEDPDR